MSLSLGRRLESLYNYKNEHYHQLIYFNAFLCVNGDFDSKPHFHLAFLKYDNIIEHYKNIFF